MPDARILTPIPGCEPEIGYALAALEDARRRTLETVAGVPPRVLDWPPPFERNSIGTLLYHIPLIEASYLWEDTLQQPPPPEIGALFPHPVRDASGLLYHVEGVSLDEHLERMAAVRACLLEAFCRLTLEDFHRPRQVEGYAITPHYVLHHLCQHEAEHRGHIQEIKQSVEMKG